MPRERRQDRGASGRVRVREGGRLRACPGSKSKWPMVAGRSYRRWAARRSLVLTAASLAALMLPGGPLSSRCSQTDFTSLSLYLNFLVEPTLCTEWIARRPPPLRCREAGVCEAQAGSTSEGYTTPPHLRQEIHLCPDTRTATMHKTILAQ